MPKLLPTVLCTCGEHFVASFLSGMGLVVALTRRGAPATDLIVTSGVGGRSAAIQVKSGGVHSHVVSKRNPDNNCWSWRIGNKATVADDLHWYAFVFVGDWPSNGGTPEVFFVPSKFVAKKRNDPETTEGWFWMLESEGEEYRGLNGYKKLAKVLRISSLSSIRDS